ncbi:hypothetical protein N9B94_00435 [Verrucomicrobia bacterium]|nr:hypothetical protein [Verrucomicrobiota bacterium]
MAVVRIIFIILSSLYLFPSGTTAGEFTNIDVARALRKSTEHLAHRVMVAGGHPSPEAETGISTHREISAIDTATLGHAFIDAFTATQDHFHLLSAEKAATALRMGQLDSGGWESQIHLDPEKRERKRYRFSSDGSPRHHSDLSFLKAPTEGWHDWRVNKFPNNITELETTVTQTALLFLIRFDQITEFKHQDIHHSIQYSLTALQNAQYPNGAWSSHFDRFPNTSPTINEYPILKTSKAKSSGINNRCYVLANGMHSRLIDCMIAGNSAYNDLKCRKSAIQGGRFLLDSKLPSSTPAWSGSYDAHMFPLPPTIDLQESIHSLESLIRVFDLTKNHRFLSPIPQALAHLEKLELSMVQTNALENIRTELEHSLTKTESSPPSKPESDLIAGIIRSQDKDSGNWQSSPSVVAGHMHNLSNWLLSATKQIPTRP